MSRPPESSLSIDLSELAARLVRVATPVAIAAAVACASTTNTEEQGHSVQGTDGSAAPLLRTLPARAGGYPYCDGQTTPVGSTTVESTPADATADGSTADGSALIDAAAESMEDAAAGETAPADATAGQTMPAGTTSGWSGLSGPCCVDVHCIEPPNGGTECPATALYDVSDGKITAQYFSDWSLGSGRCACQMDGPFSAASAQQDSVTEGPCCYVVGIQSCTGRPLLVRGTARLASLVSGGGWV